MIQKHCTCRLNKMQNYGLHTLTQSNFFEFDSVLKLLFCDFS